MPSFFVGNRSRALPPSPPDYNQLYCQGRDVHFATHMPTHMPYVSNAKTFSRYDKDGHEFADRYSRQSVFAAPGHVLYSQPPIQPPIQPPSQPPSYDGLISTALARPQRMYGSGMGPVLPPMQLKDCTALDDLTAKSYRRAPETRSEPKTVKEEKAQGGVSAHLDYEMDQMSDFVSDMAQGIVQPNSPVPPAFRKFVSQLLSSTRLPSSTILLALHYLATRMTMLSTNGSYKASNGQVYRMTTIALLLGSKFLDDNTFQNRSWSEVSGLTVSELNTLEVEWLIAIDWTLHLDPLKHDGFGVMKEHWRKWTTKATVRSRTVSQLPPIDTNMSSFASQRRDHSSGVGFPPLYSKSHSASVSMEASQMPYQNGWNYARATVEYSPPSAPDTGPATPDYRIYQGPWHLNAQPPSYTARQTGHAYSQIPPYQRTPYAQHFSAAIWNRHGAGCVCAYCVSPQEPYYLPTNYCLPPVAG